MSDGSPNPVIFLGQEWFVLGGIEKYFYMCICRKLGFFFLFLFLEIKQLISILPDLLKVRFS